MAYVHIGHDCQVGSNVIMSSNAQLAGHVHDRRLRDRRRHVAACTSSCAIGAHAMLGGASALVQDVPPFVIAAGNKAEPHGINVEGLRRRGFSRRGDFGARARPTALLYTSGLSLEEAKVQLRELGAAGGDGDAPVTRARDFLAASQRGIIR